MSADGASNYARNLIPLDDEALLSVPRAEKVKDSPTRLVVRIPDPEHPGEWLYVKRYVPRATFKRFIGRFLRSKVLLEYRQMLKATALGIPVPQAIAAAETRRLGAWCRGFLVSRAVECDWTLEQFAETVNSSPELRRAVRKLVARTLADSHAKGFIHDDLNAEHVFISVQGGRPAIHWIDLANALLTKRTCQWHRVKNLTQLHKSLPDEHVSLYERLRFVLEYGRAAHLSHDNLREMLARIETITRLKRNKKESGLKTLTWLWRNFAPIKRTR